MPLSPIGDIANAGLTEDQSQPITWEAASDWDNFTTEDGVVHESVTNTDHTDDTLLKMGYSAASPYLPTNLASFWFFNEDSGGTANDLSSNTNDINLGTNSQGVTSILGTTGFRTDSERANLPYDTSWDTVGQTHTILMWVKPNENPNDTSHFIAQGDSHTAIWHDGSVVRCHALDSGGTLQYGDTNTTLSAGNWYLVGQRFDNSTTEINSIINATTSGDLTQSTSRSDSNSDMEFGGSGSYNYDVTFGGMWIWHEWLTDTEIQTFYDVIRAQSTHTTGTKSFAGSQTPNLSSLDYTLNGESITLDVIGSPGTASEEVVSQTLGGATSYTLSWSNAHTDFRVKPKIDTTTDTVTPTVNSITLSPP